MPPSRTLKAFVTNSYSQCIGWFFCGTILYQFNPDEQSLSSNVANLLVAFLEFVQPREQILSALPRLFNQPFFLDDVDDGKPGCGGKWVRDVRGNMHEAFAIAIRFDL